MPANAGNLRMFSTGTLVYGGDRTGQLVREGEGEVWLVKSTNDGPSGHHHVAVNERGDERALTEDRFWPWGSWQKVGG